MKLVCLLAFAALDFAVGSPVNKNINKFSAAAEKKETRREYVQEYFAPFSSYCGFQHSDDYAKNGNDTAITEFPWLVHIEYQSPYLHPKPGTEFKCAGVLISDQLVLTSYACAGNVITRIKVGQYDKHSSTSCVTSKPFGKECNDPVIVTFGSRQTVDHSDLILIKLTEKINYSDYVRPICLPFQESHRPKDGDTVFTSGWGEEDVTGGTVRIKKKIAHKLDAYKHTERRDEVSFGSSGSSVYVCEGDQGGPLMYLNNHQWYLAGLVIDTPCNDTQAAVANGLTAKTMDYLMDPIFYFLPQK